MYLSTRFISIWYSLKSTLSIVWRWANSGILLNCENQNIKYSSHKCWIKYISTFCRILGAHRADTKHLLCLHKNRKFHAHWILNQNKPLSLSRSFLHQVNICSIFSAYQFYSLTYYLTNSDLQLNQQSALYSYCCLCCMLGKINYYSLIS